MNPNARTALAVLMAGTPGDTSGTNVTREPTFGEKAVGLSFNPSNDPAVNITKTRFAVLIDSMHELRATGTPGQARHASVAITELESAQMRAVKALTWKE